MRRWIMALALAGGVLGATGAYAQGPTLLVVGKGENAVAIHTGSSYKLVAKVPTGRGPREIVVSPDGKWAYVSDFDDPANTLTVVNVPARKFARKIRIPKVWGPHSLAISHDGRTLYVTCEKSRAIAVIDAASGKLTNTFNTGMTLTHMLVLSPDGKWLWATNRIDRNVTIVDLVKGAILRHVYSGAGCVGIDISPDGSQVWVANQGVDQNLTIIDTATHKAEEDRLPCQGYPIRVRFTPDGKYVLVSCSSANLVRVFDAHTRKVAGEIATGHTPWGITVSPDSRTAYVTNAADGTVAVVNLGTLAVKTTFTTANTPTAVALIP